MPDLRSTDTDRIELQVGQIVRLESMRQAVVPPFLMLMPFIELPSFLGLVREESLPEDGVHGAVFVIEAAQAGTGSLRIGFRDLTTDQITHQKRVAVEVR